MALLAFWQPALCLTLKCYIVNFFFVFFVFFGGGANKTEISISIYETICTSSPTITTNPCVSSSSFQFTMHRVNAEDGLSKGQPRKPPIPKVR